VQSGFDGIIINAFGHYLAGFSGFIQGSSDILYAELYAIYKGLFERHVEFQIPGIII
jgi:hypothetical protein